MHDDLIDPKDIEPPEDLDILDDVPSQNLRSKTRLKSTTKDIPDVINRCTVVDDPQLRPLSDDEDPDEYERVNLASQKIKDISDVAQNFLYDEDLEEDPLFAIDEILDHNLTKKGLPLFKVKWSSDQEETWVKMSQLKEDEPFLLASYVVENNLRGNRKFQYKWARRFLYKIKMIARSYNLGIHVKNRKTSTSFKLPKETMHGVSVPRTATQALELDAYFKNKNGLKR